MKAWKNKLVPVLFGLAGVGWLVKTLKQIIKEEPVTMAPLVCRHVLHVCHRLWRCCRAQVQWRCRPVERLTRVFVPRSL
jgi:hypothetical protein